jgi:hypothetical protein
MGKIDLNKLEDYVDSHERYEKFTKSNRKKANNEENFLQSQGKSVGGRTTDTYIGQRTKART